MNTGLPKIGHMRLPLRAAAFVALVCVAILAMSGWREWNSRGDELKAAEVDMANLARSLTQHAEDSFDLLDTSILGAISRLETDGTGAETLSTLRKIFVARTNGFRRIHGIAIADENGDRLTSTVETGKNIGGRGFFDHHRQSTSRDVFIGPPVQSYADGAWIMTVSRRFNHRDGSFAGVVYATVAANYFSEFYRQFDIGENSAITLLNAGGIVLARSRDNDTFIGRDTSNTPLFRNPSLQTSGGVYYFKSPLDGMQRLSFYKRSDRFPLVLLATVQQDEVLAPRRKAAAIRMLFVLGLVGLIAVIGFHLVRQLQRGQRMAAALVSKEANFRVLAENSSDMVTRIGLDERIQYVSPSSVRIVGWRPDQLVETPALAGVNLEDLPRVQQTVAALRRGDTDETRISYRTRHREKSEIWVESTLRVTRTENGEIDGVVAISRDMTEQKDLEGRLATLAIEDGLTGLANRRSFDARLEEEWARASRERTSLSVLMIDLDCFKAFNDEYGHPDGCRYPGGGSAAACGSRGKIWRGRIRHPAAQHRCCRLCADGRADSPRRPGGRHSSRTESPVQRGHRQSRRSDMQAGSRTLGGIRCAGRVGRPCALRREGWRPRPAGHVSRARDVLSGHIRGELRRT